MAPVSPQALHWSARLAAEVFNAPTICVTENGAAFGDVVTPAGEVLDLDRREYLRGHLISPHRAVAEGYRVSGYFARSSLDIFEWVEGYAKRFGLVHGDFATRRRIPKISARRYAEVKRANRVV